MLTGYLLDTEVLVPQKCEQNVIATNILREHGCVFYRHKVMFPSSEFCGAVPGFKSDTLK